MGGHRLGIPSSSRGAGLNSCRLLGLEGVLIPSCSVLLLSPLHHVLPLLLCAQRRRCSGGGRCLLGGGRGRLFGLGLNCLGFLVLLLLSCFLVLLLLSCSFLFGCSLLSCLLCLLTGFFVSCCLSVRLGLLFSVCLLFGFSVGLLLGFFICLLLSLLFSLLLGLSSFCLLLALCISLLLALCVQKPKVDSKADDIGKQPADG